MSVMDGFTGYQYGLTNHSRVRRHQRESICEINGDGLDNKARDWSAFAFLCLIWQH